MRTSRRRTQEARIVGGQDVADPKRYPYFTYVEFVAQIGNQTYSYNCGGTLVHDDVVLTSGHCWQDSVIFAMAFVNATDFRNTQYEYPAHVRSHVVHPNYSSETKGNDIMLMFLLQSFQNVPKVPLDTLKSPPPVGTNVTAIGFGDLYFGGGFDEQLQEVQVEVSDFEECDQIYGGQLRPSLQLCASYPGRDTCSGDSGGPLLISNDDGADVQVGITSFGYKCAEFPGVYVRVSSHMAWIEEEICLGSRVDGWCPTPVPSSSPSAPTTEPSASSEPSLLPSFVPSETPSLLPSWGASEEPSFDPSLSEEPSSDASLSEPPSLEPSWSEEPSFDPSLSESPSLEPSILTSGSVEPSQLLLPRIELIEQQHVDSSTGTSASSTVLVGPWVVLVLLLRMRL